MLGEQAEANEQVRFSAAHRLLEMEDRLRRNASESRHTLGDEVLHALRDVRLVEKAAASPSALISSSSCSIWSLSLIDRAFA